MGNPGFPISLRAGCALTFPRAGGVGKPGFPISLRAGCALTFPRAGAWGNRGSLAMNMIWERGRPARIASPRAW
jgi:hypothetical protein